jgi:mRNA-degrading endonuclease toxin of MazEF toxin-antitoxin module
MTAEVPKPGELIRYSYLWHDEHRAGHEEGLKDRPCAVVMSLVTQAGETRLIVLPVTHSAPAKTANAVELPPDTKRRLGLDGMRSWIILDEANRFTWPGPDIRPFDKRSADKDPARTISYGFLPPGLFRLIRDRYLALDANSKTLTVQRTE